MREILRILGRRAQPQTRLPGAASVTFRKKRGSKTGQGRLQGAVYVADRAITASLCMGARKIR